MSESPAITVITSTYNWPEALREAMATVLSQCFADFEYLVVGDCCTDATEEVVQSFNDPRIRWVNLPENTGNQSGVNRIALEMARADYIAYLNHDDLWFPEHLQGLYDAIRTNSLDIVSSLALSIKPPGFEFREIIGLPWEGGDGAMDLYPMTTNVMHTRAAAIEAGGWIDWRETHEIPTQDFFQRIRQLRGRFGVLSDVTALKFHSGDRKNSYRERSGVELSRYAAKIKEDPAFRYREVMKSLAFKSMKVRAPIIPLSERPEDAPKGWLIEQWRVNRGLSPMLDGDSAVSAGERTENSAELTNFGPAPVHIQPGDRALAINLSRAAPTPYVEEETLPTRQPSSSWRTWISRIRRALRY